MLQARSDITDKKLLLHACCGPCALGCIEPLLFDGADITLFYYNPCIMDGEYDLRLEALQTVAAHYNLPLVAPPHDRSGFCGFASDLSEQPEGGNRCALCMADRLEAAALYAASNGFDIYSTTLTVSPHKNSALIFSLAEDLERRGIGGEFYARDFKKRDGFKLSVTRSRELGIYRQRFCGCEYSLRDSEAYYARG